MEDKEYYTSEYITIAKHCYFSLLPIVIIGKESSPASDYKGWLVHLGFLCFSINFNW